MTANAKALGGDKFRAEITTNAGYKIVTLKGVIDEDAAFDNIKKAGGPYVFNFRELQSINSCGIRSWVNFLKEIAGEKVFYEECPPLVVRQLNMVPSFLGHAQVLSVYLPYVCDSTEAEQLVLLDLRNVTDPVAQVKATLPCDTCKDGEIEFDGHPKQYFAFWRS